LKEWESSGLFDKDDEDVKDDAIHNENDESGIIKLSNNPPVRRENKKTEKERRKLKEVRKMERDTEHKKKKTLKRKWCSKVIYLHF
jgi:hypothetical protein